VAGRAAQVLAKAGETPPEVAKAIRNETPADWDKHALVAYGKAPGGEGAYVFTSRWDEQNAFACVSFVPGDTKGTWSPVRIDYVSLREYARIRQEQKGRSPAASAARAGSVK
jgi:hypothetical protein